MAYICDKPYGSCPKCIHYRYDPDRYEKACWAAVDELSNNCNIDNCSRIIENLKWFLYESGDSDIIVRNEFGFEHDTAFVSWVGDGHSFILKDDTGEYRIQISKEVE